VEKVKITSIQNADNKKEHIRRTCVMIEIRMKFVTQCYVYGHISENASMFIIILNTCCNGKYAN